VLVQFLSERVQVHLAKQEDTPHKSDKQTYCLQLIQVLYLYVRIAMQKMHGIMPYISSQIQNVVCKFGAQVVGTNQLSQHMLSWLVQDEAGTCSVIMLKEEDDRLHNKQHHQLRVHALLM